MTTFASVLTFAGPTELYAAAQAAGPLHETTGGYEPSGWFGDCPTFDDALYKARVGWPKGTQTAQALAQRLSADIVTSLSRPQISYDVTGDQFDMGLVVEGIPECWMTWDNVLEGTRADDSTKAPVTIVYNNGARAAAEGDMLTRKGASALALALVLQSLGRPVRILIGTRCIEGTQHTTVFKDFYNDLECDSCAFAMMHPSSHRRINFAIRKGQGLRSAGSSVDLDIDKGDIYIGHASEDTSVWGSDASADKWIRQQLLSQGVGFTAV